MADLQERLRDESWRGRQFPFVPVEMEVWHKTCCEAADEIDALTKRVEELEAELPTAAEWQTIYDALIYAATTTEHHDIRDARKALTVKVLALIEAAEAVKVQTEAKKGGE